MGPVARACIGIAIWLCLDSALVADVVISEIMSRNVNTLADEDGDFSDWVELFNDSDARRSISGWHLSDTPLNPLPMNSKRKTLRLLLIFSGTKMPNQ